MTSENILFWNVRGLIGKARRDSVKEFVVHERVSVGSSCCASVSFLVQLLIFFFFLSLVESAYYRLCNPFVCFIYFLLMKNMPHDMVEKKVSKRPLRVRELL
jgi:hypothetical protein